MPPPFVRLAVIRLALVFVVIAALAACTTDPNGDKSDSRWGEQVGTIVGAVGGAILGSRVGRGNVRTLGTVGGGILGAWAGARLGRMFDQRDRQMQKQAADDAMRAPLGQPVNWSNPQSGNSGKVTPLTEQRRPSDGASCRTFEQSVVTKDGQVASEKGTACRAPDGTWRVAD